jgi:hypothetical protein
MPIGVPDALRRIYEHRAEHLPFAQSGQDAFLFAHEKDDLWRRFGRPLDRGGNTFRSGKINFNAVRSERFTSQTQDLEVVENPLRRVQRLSKNSNQ